MALDFPTGIADGHEYEGFYWDAAAGVWRRLCDRDRIGDCLDENADETVCDRLTFLQNEIIELEEEIDALAPSIQRGSWQFTLSGAVTGPGIFTAYDEYVATSGDPVGLVTSIKSLWFHSNDNAGTPHGFDNVEEGNLLELFVEGSAEYGLFVVKAAHDYTAGAGDYWVIDVDCIRTLEQTTRFDNGEVCRLKIFEAPSGGDASEFVRKDGDEMSGDLTFLSTYDAYHHDATTASTRIEFENTKTDGTVSKTYLYKLGTLDGIASSGQFRCKGNFTVSNDIIGWNASTGSIYNSRIALDSGGGRIKWGSTEIAAWAGGGFYYYGDVTNDRHVATKEYVDEYVEQASQKYISSGKRLGEWYSTSSNYEPGNLCSDKGEAKKHNGTSELYISFRDRNGVSHEDYFSSLKVGDKLYYQKRDQGNSILEEAAITSIQLDSAKCTIRIKPYDIFEQSKTYILYDGLPQLTASVPSPNGYYLKLTGNDCRSASESEVTDQYIYRLTYRGQLSTSNLGAGVFIPYGWIKRHYPNFSGFNFMEGINKSFIKDTSMNRIATFDPYGPTSGYEAEIKSTKFNNVPGIAFYANDQRVGLQNNSPIELYGIQEAVYFD